MALRVVTPPVIRPVSLAEAKAFCRVTHDLDDAMIDAMIAAAVAACEQITGRALVEQTLELVLDEFPRLSIMEMNRGESSLWDRIVLPAPPLLVVESIQYVDVEGAEQAMVSGAYTVSNASDFCKAFIVPAYGTTWPATRDVPGAVRVRFVAGWPASEGSPTTATTPDAIRQWILCRVSGLYAQREAVVIGQAVAAMPRDFLDGLLDPYRVLGVW
jgi:uncharacterized phiE125 gp8 family phage protein